MKNKFQFVSAVHGNEPMPALALASVGVEQIIANPKALSQNLRFSEKDLNASFGSDGATYEEKRARELLELISPDIPLIDFHTFSADSDPFAVIVDLAMLPLARRLGLPHVVYMHHNIKKGHALINYRSGVSVEMGQHADPASFTRTIKLIAELQNTKPKKKAIVYEVYDIIDKPGEYINFLPHIDGFIPILAGENAYAFPGLKAKIRIDL